MQYHLQVLGLYSLVVHKKNAGDLRYRNLVNFRATNFSILIVCCGYSSRFRFTHEILSPRKKRQTIITYLPGHVNAY